MTSPRRKEKSESKNPKEIATVSRILFDGSIVELLYRPRTHSTAFAVWRRDEWSLERHIDTTDGTRLVPFSPDNNLIKNEAVLLPSEPLDYGSEEQLLRDVQAFLHRYVDLSPLFEQVAVHYVFFTWLYDAFSELPYLRLRGDFGTGKTRTLLTIGSICYKPFFASGASTVSPIFHTLNAFGGTLIFDEADFRFSDERAEIVKILNNGNVRGLPVLRTIMNQQKEFNPQAFQVFGPKIVATRGSYDDKGLESRFLTEEMGGRRLRSDIPINMPESFKDEARELRNKLLLFRFQRRHQARLDPTLSDPELEPRLNQILLPLLSIVRDASAREQLREIAHTAQRELVAERGLLIELQVLEVLAELLTAERVFIPVAEITAMVTVRHGSEYDRPITNCWVGGILRKRLNVRTFKRHGVYVVAAAERAKIELLSARYGINDPIGEEQPVSDREIQSGDVGTSGTS